MGLLDWAPDEDALALPCFDSGFAPVTNTEKTIDDKFNAWSFTKAQSDSLRDRSTTTSTSDANSTRSEQNQSPALSSDSAVSSNLSNSSRSSRPASPKPRKHRMHSHSVKRAPRRRQSSFDLFGDDSELQEAEPRIGYCDICLKHCDVH